MPERKFAFSLIELLIVVIIAIIMYIAYSNSNSGRQNPFGERTRINTQQQIVNDKIQQIEDKKALRRKIEHNLRGGY